MQMDPNKIYPGIRLLLNTGNHDAALLSLEKMMEVFPDHAVARKDLGMLYCNLGDFERALENIEAAVELDPENIGFKKSLAQLYDEKLNRIGDAAKIYVEIVSRYPNEVEALFKLSKICVLLGKPTEAVVFCQRILAIEPWHQEAREFFSRLSESKDGSSSYKIKDVSLPATKGVISQSTEGPASDIPRQALAKEGEQAKIKYRACENVRVLVCIASSGVKNHPYTIRMLEEFAKMPFDVDVIVRGTEIIDYPRRLREKLGIRHIRHPRSEGYRLTYFHRCDVTYLQDEYDLYIYNEHDQLITRENIEGYLFHAKDFPGEIIPGFLRYGHLPEEDPHARSEKYLIDIFEHSGFDPSPAIEYPWVEVNGRRYFSTKNRHQGSWFMTREQLKRAIQSDGFVASWHGGPYGVSEQACSDPYTQCGFDMKVIPYDDLDNFLIHHMPDRYTYTGMPLLMLKSYLAGIKEPSLIFRKPSTKFSSGNLIANPKIGAPCRHEYNGP
ncbi:hypothetical protein D1AOALGA4SA_1983 [Olavius algarvensis Delta 1 endosymbiont]|nr:hypothetical protein D1AOALGA4SA_1983 [Olavius algarvensis Delta 1 endosymbiont]